MKSGAKPSSTALVVGRARQRRQNKELEQIDRQFLCTVRMSRAIRCGKAENIAGVGGDPLGPPGEEHLAVFVHPVLLFLGLQQIVGVDVFEPLAAGARRLLNKVRYAMAERVDLNCSPSPSFSRISIRRSKIASRLRLRAKLSSVMKKRKTPWTRLARTSRSTSLYVPGAGARAPRHTGVSKFFTVTVLRNCSWPGIRHLRQARPASRFSNR